MNILILGWRGPKHPNAGGAEQVVHEHAKGWVEAGHDVTLFTSNFTGAKPEEIIDGVKIIRKSFQYWGVHFAAFYWYVFKKHIKFDIVVDQFHGIPFFTPVYMRIKKIALIQEVTREVWYANQMPFPINYIIGIIGYIGEPLIFLLYKKVHFMTGSNSAKLDLLKYGIKYENITIIPHGVLLREKPKVFSKKDPKIISFLGAVTKDKGVEDVIKTFVLLNKNNNLRYWIIGKYAKSYKTDLVNKIKDIELREKIKFWGYVDTEKKFDLLKQTFLLINPSIREGWGLVNIEANSVGTPVVAYKSAGLVDSVNNNKSGILVDNNSPEALADTIEKIIDNIKIYDDLQNSAVQWSKKFNWQKSRKLSLMMLTKILE